MSRVAELIIEIGADTADAERGLDNVNEKVGKSDGLFSKAAGGVLGFAKNLLKIGGIATTVMGLPVIGGGIMSAWNQVSGVEQATVAMNAYADSSEEVDAVLAQLLGYARSDMGVLFNRTELFSAAQSMLMYGASINDVADYTEVLSRSVGLGLSDWDQLNTVIGRVGSTGRLTGQDFDYLKAAGFQLDDSLRNTNMTWEELFHHLDAGIPSDALAGQADTIRGKMIRLQSAFRNVGNAILGVDSETSKFIEGGLGDMLVKGIDKARAALNASVPIFALFAGGIASAFSSIGEVVGPVFDFVINVLGKFGEYVKPFGTFPAIFYALAGAMDETFGAGSGNKIITFYMNLKNWTETAKDVLSQIWGVITSVAFALWDFGTSVAGLVADFVGFVQGSDNAKLAIESLAVGLGIALTAFVAFQTVQSLVGVFNAIRTAVLGFNAALMANPVVLVVAAIAALGAAVYFAYQKFEPFRKVVDKVGSVLKDLGKAIGRQVVKGFDALMSAIRPVASLLGGTLLSGAKNLWSALQTLGSITGGSVVSAFNNLRDAAEAAWNVIQSAFGGTALAIFENVKNTVEEIIDPFIALKDAISAAFEGDWSSAFSKLGEAAKESFEAMVSVAKMYVDNLIAVFTQTDWAALWDGLKSAATAAWDGLVSLASSTWDAITGFFSSIDWGGIWNGLQSGASAAWDGLVSFFSSIDWGSLVSDLGQWLVDKGSSLIGGLESGIDTAWTTVTEWLGTLGSLASAAVPVLLETLKQKGKDLIGGIRSGATEIWGNFTTWLSQIGGKAVDFIGNVGSILLGKGKDLLNGMKKGAQDAWGTFSIWVSQIPSKVRDFVGDAFNTLKEKGEDIIDGLKAGAEAGWNTFTSWLTGAVNGAIDILNGLIEGINTLYTWTGAPSIPIIPKIGEDAEASAEKVDALSVSLRNLSSSLGKNVGDLALDALSDNWQPTSDGGIYESDTGTTAVPAPAADPLDFGNAGALRSGKGGGILSTLQNIVTNAKLAGGALQGFNTEQVKTGNQSVTSFGQMDQSARPAMVGVDAHVRQTSSSIQGAWGSSLNQMVAQSTTQFGVLRSRAQNESNQARNSVTSNSASMASNLGSNLLSMSAAARTQMSATYGSVDSQMSASSRSTSTQTAAMSLAARVQLAAMSATTRTEMSATYGSISSQMTASSAATTAQTTAMALVTRVQLGLASANAKSQMSTMASNVQSGATAASGHLSGQAARWSAIILTAGSAAASTARSVGANIGNSLAGGMMSALGTVKSAANALIAQVDRAMRAKARIASPSKMTTYFGEMIGEGLVSGMEHTMGDVAKAGTQLSNAALHTPQGFGTPSHSTSNPIGSAGSNINVHKIEVTIPVKDVADIKTAVDFVKRLDTEYELKTAGTVA